MMDDAGIFAEAARLARSGMRFALAGIVDARGSTPRSRARMLVRGDASALGTIGGGIVESKVIADAMDCMRLSKSRLIRYDLDSLTGNDSVGMLCGGSMEVFIDVVPARKKLVIVGAGHVGQALAKLADFAGFGVVLVDERKDMANAERFPMAESIYCDENLGIALEKLPVDAEASVVIATHADDETALRALIAKPWNYIGMMGSRRKVKAIMEKLKGEGLAQDLLSKVRAPIGLDIEAETPEEIAVSIIAEILADANNASGDHLAGKLSFEENNKTANNSSMDVGQGKQGEK